MLSNIVGYQKQIIQLQNECMFHINTIPFFITYSYINICTSCYLQKNKFHLKDNLFYEMPSKRENTVTVLLVYYVNSCMQNILWLNMKTWQFTREIKMAINESIQNVPCENYASPI